MKTIYHLVPQGEFRAGLKDGLYRPARMGEDGFVHCAVRERVLEVASSYFAGAGEPVLLLAIDASRLGAKLLYEAPAPIPGGGNAHLAGDALFPHVYGPIEIGAVTGVGLLVKRGRAFEWPDRFLPVREALGRGAAR